METFQVAHLNIQNVNLVVIFLNTAFDSKSPQEQQTIHMTLQAAATSAGLAGNVVPVWLDPFGRTKFIAPPQQHPFFRSASYEQLYAQVNRTLTCP
ncbi:MAG: hypothetical protein LLG20_00380 [Acidobacteriales bacterium]|nr:hypothetical protein [Terriglobales bacterium]